MLNDKLSEWRDVCMTHKCVGCPKSYYYGNPTLCKNALFKELIRELDKADAQLDEYRKICDLYQINDKGPEVRYYPHTPRKMHKFYVWRRNKTDNWEILEEDVRYIRVATFIFESLKGAPAIRVCDTREQAEKLLADTLWKQARAKKGWETRKDSDMWFNERVLNKRPHSRQRRLERAQRDKERALAAEQQSKETEKLAESTEQLENNNECDRV